MRSTFSIRIPSFLVFLIFAAASSLAAPGHGKSRPNSNSTSKFFGPLKAFKNSETYYHRNVPQVPYYKDRPPGLSGNTRTFFFAVEEIDYDYAPLGFDHFNGNLLNKT